jgi:sulfotransferase family protein
MARAATHGRNVADLEKMVTGKNILRAVRKQMRSAAHEIPPFRYLLELNNIRKKCNDLELRLSQKFINLPLNISSLEERRNRAAKSIFFSSLPKSGTEFFWGGLRDITGLSAPALMSNQSFLADYFSGYYIGDEVTSTGVFTSERLLPGPLAQLMAGGAYIIGAHAPASFHNLSALFESGIRKVAILIRDPRDATVSWTYHLRSAANLRNFTSLAMHIPTDYYQWPHERQLAYQVRTFLPVAVNWIESWLEAPVFNRELKILHVAFEDLVREPEKTFERSLSFFGREDYDLSKLTPAQRGLRHFRKGKSGQWREEFSKSDGAFAQDLMTDRIPSGLLAT